MTGDLDFFLRGVLLGLAVAAPVGPIGVLCIQRSLAGGFWTGFSGGIGTAVADALYAALAAAGFAAFAGGLGMVGQVPVQQILQWAGALFIAWLGWRTFVSAPADASVDVPAQEEKRVRSNPLRLFAVTFALTMSNPSTILSFAALFAGLGLAADADLVTAASVVAGVFIGSLLWWAILSGGISLLHRSMSATHRPLLTRAVNRIAGIVLILFAIALVL